MSCERCLWKEKCMDIFSIVDNGFWVLFALEAAMICVFAVVFLSKRINGKSTNHVFSMLINTLMIFGMTLSGLLVYLAIKGIAGIIAKIIWNKRGYGLQSMVSFISLWILPYIFHQKFRLIFVEHNLNLLFWTHQNIRMALYF